MERLRVRLFGDARPDEPEADIPAEYPHSKAAE
jgi:hypothetical protein